MAHGMWCNVVGAIPVVSDISIEMSVGGAAADCWLLLGESIALSTARGSLFLVASLNSPCAIVLFTALGLSSFDSVTGRW